MSMAIFHSFCVCCDLTEEYVHNRGLMHVKYILALCQNVTLKPIISEIMCVCSDISKIEGDFVHIRYSDQPP